MSLLRFSTALIAVSLLAGSAGCSKSTAVSADDSIFAGLDPATVREVIDLPTARKKLEGVPDDPVVHQRMWQGMVRNFTLCRSAYAAYLEWSKSGVNPTLSKQPQPTNVVQGAEVWDADVEGPFRGALASGDIDQLRAGLTNETGCGAWIPVKPGSTQTIAAAISSGK